MTNTVATYRNVYQFSTSVPETKHDGHEVEVGKKVSEGEPDNVCVKVTCMEDGEEFSAFGEEIFVDRLS